MRSIRFSIRLNELHTAYNPLPPERVKPYQSLFVDSRRLPPQLSRFPIPQSCYSGYRWKNRKVRLARTFFLFPDRQERDRLPHLCQRLAAVGGC